MTDDPFRPFKVEIIAELRRVLEAQAFSHGKIMRYHMGFADADENPTSAPSGSPVHASLCLIVAKAVGGDLTTALPAAETLELITNFSLVQDDIEDDRLERFGRPTLMQTWGMPRAINASDGLYSLAQLTLQRLSQNGVTPERLLAISLALDGASLRLFEGQYLDLDLDGRDEISEDDYLTMVEAKTGTLMGVAAEVGALVGGASETTAAAFRSFGANLGVAHHIGADYLRTWDGGDAAKAGSRSRRWSYPLIVAIDSDGVRLATVSIARAYVSQAIEALTSIGLSEEWRDRLTEVAHFLGGRASI